MANISNNKLKLLYIMKALMESSDENNRLSTEALKKTVEEHGMTIDRKSIYDDIGVLQEMGYDVLYNKESPAGYYIGSRDFDLAEIKLLVDAVQSSKFITDKKSRELIGKLGRLINSQQAKDLERQVYAINRVKTFNESIYYNVDRIHDAIVNNRQISFKYHRWNLKKELEPKRGGELYRLSPWAMTWEDENYYMIAYDEELGIIKYYRVDKMKSIEVLKDPRIGGEAFEEFDISKFATRTFNMWGTDSKTVTLRCENELVGPIIDRFGTDVIIVKDGKEHFKVKLDVSVTNQFYGWLVGLGHGVEIVRPKKVKNEFKEHLEGFMK